MAFLAFEHVQLSKARPSLYKFADIVLFLIALCTFSILPRMMSGEPRDDIHAVLSLLFVMNCTPR